MSNKQNVYKFILEGCSVEDKTNIDFDDFGKDIGCEIVEKILLIDESVDLNKVKWIELSGIYYRVRKIIRIKENKYDRRREKGMGSKRSKKVVEDTSGKPDHNAR